LNKVARPPRSEEVEKAEPLGIQPAERQDSCIRITPGEHWAATDRSRNYVFGRAPPQGRSEAGRCRRRSATGWCDKKSRGTISSGWAREDLEVEGASDQPGSPRTSNRQHVEGAGPIWVLRPFRRRSPASGCVWPSERTTGGGIIRAPQRRIVRRRVEMIPRRRPAIRPGSFFAERPLHDGEGPAVPGFGRGRGTGSGRVRVRVAVMHEGRVGMPSGILRDMGSAHIMSGARRWPLPDLSTGETDGRSVVL